MRTYKFTVLCRSGQTKTFEFEAENYTQARRILQDYVDKN